MMKHFVYKGTNPLDGYISGKTCIVRKYGCDYLKTVFQGDHKNEYTLIQQQNNKNHGEALLINRGIVSCSWNYCDGCISSGYTYYENGRVVQEDFYDAENYMKYSYVEYPQKKLLVIYDDDTMNAIYIGDFREGTNIREGLGYFLDAESGNLISYGLFKDDECLYVYQEFTSSSSMIEYDYEKANNEGIQTQYPIYSGGCKYNVATNTFVRHGKGCLIRDGIAKEEAEWSFGRKIYSFPLQNGYFIQNSDEVTNYYLNPNKLIVSKSDDLKKLIPGDQEGKDSDDSDYSDNSDNSDNSEYFDNSEYLDNLEILQVQSKCCNEENDRLSINHLGLLQHLIIGSNCFRECKCFEILNKEFLIEVRIGENSFCNSTYSAGKLFRIANCFNLRSIIIGRGSFADFEECHLASLDSLEILKIGEIGDRSANFTHACVDIKTLRKCKEILLGDYVFYQFKSIKMANLPELERLILGTYACNGIESCKSRLELINFPKCTDFICIAHSFDYLSYLRIQNIPNLRNLSLNQCFSHVKEKSINRAPVLEQYIPSIL